MIKTDSGMKPFEAKAKDIFGEVCINKGLFIESGLMARSIPTFVGEWILDRFAPDGLLTDDVLDSINEFISEHLPRKDQKEAIKNRLADGDQLTILDHFSAYVDLRNNTRRVNIPCIDEKGHVPIRLLDKYPNLLGGGLWGAGKLMYNPPDSPARNLSGSVQLIDFKPMQVAQLDLDYYCEERKRFALDEWRELMVTSMGSNPDAYTPRQQQLLLARLIAIAQGRVNLIELAPKGTGKSFVYQNLSRYVRLISGGKISAPVLFYNLGTRTPGLITQFDVIVFDEAQTISFDNPGEIIGILKDYLESGRYSRGDKQVSDDTAIVILGNIPLDSSGRPSQPTLFYNLPGFLRETAFIDRLHGIIPGWEIPRVTVDTPARGVGFKADFFGEVLHGLRDRPGYDDYVSVHMRLHGTEDMRDTKAIRRLAAGFLRLLFPDLNPKPEEFQRYCIDPSVELRQAVRDQLSKMDPEYKIVNIWGEAV